MVGIDSDNYSTHPDTASLTGEFFLVKQKMG